ncbi:hypothetical protein V6N13_133127 [Hibiscus sabdariffa]|uniref:Uncharacterized protein n=1 Tax=Hibiscus sabdariffa TaxID=183260 RepID=A0ABR2PXW8_9ROSI
MCYRVDCQQCRKYTWAGCGKHLSTLFASIDEGKRCMCRPWPGVVVTTPSVNNATNTNQAPTATQAPTVATSNLR